MKNLFFYLLFLTNTVLFIGCNKNDLVTTEKKYELKNLLYTFEEGDSNELDTIHSPTQAFYNNSTATITKTINILQGVMETSQFISDNKNAFLLLPDTLNVSVPDLIFDKTIYCGQPKWLYSANIQNQLPSMKAEQTLNLTPYSKVTYDTEVIIRKYTVSYTATLVEATEKSELTIKGKWKGTIVETFNTKTLFEEIK